MESKLCPKCGAYWRCDCVIESPPPGPQGPRLLRSGPPRAEPGPQQPLAAPGCQHDWTEVVGVELDDTMEEAKVLACRLCGLYAVERSA